MLGKMLIQGLVAAVLVGSGAAVYAQATAEKSPASEAPAAATPAPPPAKDNGYLADPGEGGGKHGREAREHRPRERREGDARHRNHDD